MDRSLTMLNEMGDTTITWEEENDAEMEALIAAKMAAGVTFYLIPKRKGATPKKKLADSTKAREHRALSIPDKDFSKFVLEGKGDAVIVPAPHVIDKAARAQSAREVARGHSVGVQPRRGG